jgi:hypothetical protein
MSRADILLIDDPRPPPTPEESARIDALVAAAFEEAKSDPRMVIILARLCPSEPTA